MNNSQSSEWPIPLVRLWRQLAFAARSRWGVVLLVFMLALFGIYDYQSNWTLFDDIKSTWDKDINQVIAVATLLVAISVWWGEVVQEWHSGLQKKLTVNFVYKSEGGDARIVMRCIKANLSDVADIRSLGQQIGSQLANPDNPGLLSFRAPYVVAGQGTTEFDPDAGFTKHYEVTFMLTALPEGLRSDQCKVWQTPFDKEDITWEAREPG